MLPDTSVSGAGAPRFWYNFAMNLEPAPNSPEPVDAEISALVKRLNSLNSKKVNAAVSQLIDYGDVGVEALLSALNNREMRRKRHKNIVVASYLFCSFTTVLLAGMFGYHGLPFLGPVLITALLVVSAASNAQRQGAQLLAKLDNIRAVNLLTDALMWQDKEVARSAREALVRLLPRLKQSDVEYLTLDRRKILLKQFNSLKANPELLLAILKAMEQVGGAEAIPTVSRLAAGRGLNSKRPGIQAAAQVCLPYLQARAEGRELRDTLLRSSSAAEVAPETLLRPAPATSEEPANELLRPKK